MSFDTPGPIDEPKKMPLVVKILIGVAVLVGILFVACVGAGVWFANSEGAKEFMEATIAAQSAPGTEELRDLGCTTAMVMTFGDVSGIVGGLIEEADLGVAPETPLVICQAATGAPTCDEVASTYLAAVSPGGPFSVQVEGSGAECQMFFDAAGNPIDDPTAEASGTSAPEASPY